MPGVFGPLSSILLTAALLPTQCAAGQAQEPSAFPVPPPSQGAGRVPFGTEPDRDENSQMRHAILQGARKRNAERQQRIVADTDKIVRLAEDLCTTSDNAPADLMAKKSEEIEKLARSVRERMKAD